MKKITVMMFCFFCTLANSQSRKSIDSVNSIPFEIKIAKAVTLDSVFLKNAQDAKRIKYKLGEADSYSNLGLVYYYQGKYSLNVGNILKAIKIYDAIGAKAKQAYEYGGLGYSMKRRNLPRALSYMQKGKAIAEEHNLEEPLLSIYNNYGVLKEMQNQLDSALYFYNKGLELKERRQDSLGIPYSLNNIAGIYLMKGQFDNAEKLYARALKIRQQINDEVGIAENYSYLGDFFTAKKDNSKALGFYSKSLDKALALNYIDLIRSNYLKIATNYELLGNEKQALRNYKLYTRYKDSLLNKETNSRIAELEVQFETNKKEKLLAENKNTLLLRDADVKQRNSLIMVLLIVSLFIIVTGYLIYRQQKLKNTQLAQEHDLKTAISVIETQNKLQDQRLSISRDLHDNIGAQLTFIISSVDNIRYAFDITNSKLDHKLSNISAFTRETIVELRDTIWAMNNTEISFEDLRIRILNFIEKAKEAKDKINFDFFVDESLTNVKLTSVQGMNIYRTIQESLNNALKYADADEIQIAIKKVSRSISIFVSDNGKGFDIQNVEAGNGILNMRKRMEDIGGSFNIDSRQGEGVKISIRIDGIII